MNTPLMVVVAHDKIRSKNGVHDIIYERLRHLCDNKTELLPGFLSLVPNMPVLLTDRIAMVEWLRCWTRIHKVLCFNLSIANHGMTLDKSLTAQLSRTTHLYRTEYIISQYVGRKGVQTPPSVKNKTIETGSMWTLMITTAGTNG